MRPFLFIALISLQDIAFSFGGHYLYKDASWHIKPGEKIGLTGQNGRGKTTLLKIITGEFSIESGIISRRNGLDIGFLNQDLLSQKTEGSILDMAMSAFERALYLEKEIEKTLQELEHNYSEDWVHKLGDLQHEFEQVDGYNIRFKAEEVLEGLGFTTSDLNRPISEFSGGWRMRGMLARMLLKKPDLLMLDEPTNHLDLPAIQWVENYLINYPGTVILISHDRYFLNRVCNKIAEISQRKIHIYEGNYDYYIAEKAERTDLQQRQFDNQQQYIKDQEKFINRFRAKASKATAVQSRVKMLDKLDVIEAPQNDEVYVNIRFKVNRPSGKSVVSFEHLSKKYDEKEIFRNIHGEILRGDKIALIGANGLGKSTLLKILAGKTNFTGTLTPGYNVNQAFYAQHQLDSLNPEHTILEETSGYAPHLKETEIRTLLGCFLFSGDDVFKKIKVLSGGEKSRVALAKTISGDANFMLLDEPTNHLDFQSVNILVEALKNYEGTFLIVSHDRDFINRTANKIWWIENHELKVYPGTYEEWQEWYDRRNILQQQEKKEVETKKPAEKEIKIHNNTTSNQRKKIEKKLVEIEESITKTEIEIGEAEKLFSTEPYISSFEKRGELGIKYTKLKEQHDLLMAEYEMVYNSLNQD